MYVFVFFSLSGRKGQHFKYKRDYIGIPFVSRAARIYGFNFCN